jgi:hypothetical protein
MKSGLIRGMVFGGNGLIRERLLYFAMSVHLKSDLIRGLRRVFRCTDIAKYKSPSLIRPLSSKAIPLIKPDFRCTDIPDSKIQESLSYKASPTILSGYTSLDGMAVIVLTRQG